jgi:hypothetical protein
MTFVWLERVEDAAVRAFEPKGAEPSPLAATGT